MLIILVLLLKTKTVICDEGDVMHFNWDLTKDEDSEVGLMEKKPRTFIFNTPYIYRKARDRMDLLKKDELESEFGVFMDKMDTNLEEPKAPEARRRPKFLTQNYNKNNYDYMTHKNFSEGDKFHTRFSYIQKIPRLQAKNQTQGINLLLRNYLNKLYKKKYNNTYHGEAVIQPVGKPVNQPLGQHLDHHQVGQQLGLVDQRPLNPDDGDDDNDDEDQESKFLDSSMWQWKNKTAWNWKNKFANKFLSLFTIVQFANDQCTATSAATEYTGTCYHQTECDNMNGTALGDCANGYGVCCVFKYTCGQSSTQNCTYFESPNYPNYDPPGNMVSPPQTSTMPPNPSPTPDPRTRYYRLQVKNRWKRQAVNPGTNTSLSCSFNVFKISDDVQQMRIDFIDMELAGPTNGTCVNERFIVTGQNVNDQVPPLCGYNSGQSIYVDVSMLNGPLQLMVLSATGARKRFRMRICQIASATCTNSNNCLQYYTGVTGMISSFNYDQAAMFNRSVPGYFNNLNYAICIRKEAGYCSITYTNMPMGVEYPFQFRNVNAAGQSTVPDGQAGAEVFNCPDDYIVIGGTRLCGDKFNDGSVNVDFRMNAAVTDNSAGPITIPVRTNQAVTGRGFKLFYTQNRCTTT